MMKRFCNIFMIFIFFILLFLTPLFSKEQKTTKTKQDDSPIQMKAKNSQYNFTTKVMTLLTEDGKRPVVWKDKNFMYADKIYLYPEENIAKAEGNIVLISTENNIQSYGEHGFFDGNANELTLTEDAFIWFKESDNYIYADKIDSLLDESKSYFYDNVRMENKDMTMSSDYMLYEEPKKTLYATKDPKMELDSGVITSEEFFIYIDENDEIEKYDALTDVEIVNDEDGYILNGEYFEYFYHQKYYKLTGDPVINITKSEDDDTTENDTKIYTNVVEYDEEASIMTLLGNVIIKQIDRTSYSRWGVYETEKGIITLTGNPVLVEDDSILYGRKILLDVENNVFEAKGKTQGVYRSTGKESTL